MAPGKSKASRRPPGWSKELVLQRVAAGSRITELCRTLAGPLGVSWRTLYSDVSGWKVTDPAFLESYEGLQAENEQSAGGGRPPTASSPDRLALFLQFYRQTGQKIESAGRAGISWHTVYNNITPGKKSFNRSFKKAFDEAEREVMARMHDVFPEVALDPEVDPRTRAWTAGRFLESRDPENFGRQTNVRVSGGVQHTHRAQIDQVVEEVLGGFYLTGRVDDQVIEDAEVLDED